MIEIKLNGIVKAYSDDDTAFPRKEGSKEPDYEAAKRMLSLGYKIFKDGKNVTMKNLSEKSKS